MPFGPPEFSAPPTIEEFQAYYKWSTRPQEMPVAPPPPPTADSGVSATLPVIGVEHGAIPVQVLIAKTYFESKTELTGDDARQINVFIKKFSSSKFGLW